MISVLRLATDFECVAGDGLMLGGEDGHFDGVALSTKQTNDDHLSFGRSNHRMSKNVELSFRSFDDSKSHLALGIVLGSCNLSQTARCHNQKSLWAAFCFDC